MIFTGMGLEDRCLLEVLVDDVEVEDDDDLRMDGAAFVVVPRGEDGWLPYSGVACPLLDALPDNPFDGVLA